MVAVYELVHRIYVSTVEPHIHFWDERCELRGNSLKLLPSKCSSQKRKKKPSSFFVLKGQNELPGDVVMVPSISSFRNRPDRFWSTKHVL